jgi:hypothetical protein
LSRFGNTVNHVPNTAAHTSYVEGHFERLLFAAIDNAIGDDVLEP